MLFFLLLLLFLLLISFPERLRSRLRLRLRVGRQMLTILLSSPLTPALSPSTGGREGASPLQRSQGFPLSPAEGERAGVRGQCRASAHLYTAANCLVPLLPRRQESATGSGSRPVVWLCCL